MSTTTAYTTPVIERKALTLARRIATRCLHTDRRLLPFCTDADAVGRHIEQLLQSGKPCMVARFGANELKTVFNYLGITRHRGDAWGYIMRKNGPWWWNRQILWQMQHAAGFFPITDESVNRFSELMIKSMQQLDVLGCWLSEERAVQSYFTNAYLAALPYLEPWFAHTPWTRALRGRRVLVVHPFDKLIMQQYSRRTELFSNPDVLPEFASLKVIKAVQSYGNSSGESGFNTWFDALQYMQQQMDASDYDVCLLGCGAYGFPLAAHAKATGHQAIHLGGVTQLLFGITGSRWLDPMHRVKEWHIPQGFYARMANAAWVRPGADTMPKDAQQVENACYW